MNVLYFGGLSKKKKKKVTLSERYLVCLGSLSAAAVFCYSCITFLFWPVCRDFSTAGGVPPQNPRAVRFSVKSPDWSLESSKVNIVKQQETSKLILSELNKCRPEIYIFGTDLCFSV